MSYKQAIIVGMLIGMLGLIGCNMLILHDLNNIEKEAEVIVDADALRGPMHELGMLHEELRRGFKELDQRMADTGRQIDTVEAAQHEDDRARFQAQMTQDLLDARDAIRHMKKK